MPVFRLKADMVAFMVKAFQYGKGVKKESST
jgi:hypothetical protein